MKKKLYFSYASNRIDAVINSCVTMAQLRVAEKYCRRLCSKTCEGGKESLLHYLVTRDKRQRFIVSLL